MSAAAAVEAERELDLVGLGLAAGMVLPLVSRAWRNLREPADAEPAASRRP